MTLISVYNSAGCVGRCDARCYNATQGDCDCICRGKNHGAGQQQAMENTREMSEEWTEQYIRERRIHDAKSEVNGDIYQATLF